MPNLNSNQLLLRSAAKGNILGIKEALKNGADINTANSDGYSALHLAVFFGNESNIRFLLNHGANRNQKAKDGFSPIQWAYYRQKQSLVDFIKNYSTVPMNFSHYIDIRHSDTDTSLKR